MIRASVTAGRVHLRKLGPSGQESIMIEMTPSRVRRLIPLLAYTGLTAALFWPLLCNLGGGLHDRSDTILNAWIVNWEAHVLPLNPLALFDAPIFYPLRNTLTFSEIIWPAAPGATPLLAAAGNPVLVYNLLFLGTFPLAGLGMYLLALQVTGSRPAAFLAGLIYAFSPHQFGHLSQIQLVSIGWLPLTLFFLERLWATGRARDGACFALALAFQTLSAFYYGFQVVLAVGLYVLVRVLTARPSAMLGAVSRQVRTALRGAVFAVARREAKQSPPMRGHTTGLAMTTVGPVSGEDASAKNWLALGRVLAWAALGGLLIAPFAAPYLQVRQELGLERRIGEALAASPALLEYILPPAGHPLRLLFGSMGTEGGLFLGVIPVALAALGVLTWRARRDGVIGRGYWLAVGAAAAVLSLGPRLKVTPADAGGLILPFGWLFEHVPGMTVIRAPGRFAVSVYLALALLAAAGAAWLFRRLARRGARGLVWALLAAACLAEYIGGRGPFEVHAMPRLDPAPPVYRWLAQQPPTVILELPLSSDISGPPGGPAGDLAAAWPDSNLLRHEYFGTAHWQRSVDGYSGFVPPHHRELGLTLADFPSPRSLALLRGLEVGLVIVHRDLMEAYQPGRAAALRTALAVTPGIVHEGDFAGPSGPAWVYRLTSRATAASPPIGRFVSTTAGQAFLLLAAGSAPATAVLPPGQPLHVAGAWQAADGSSALLFERTVTLPLLVGEGSVVRLDLPRPARPGPYTLRLNATDAAWGIAPYEQPVTLAADAAPAALLAIHPMPPPGRLAVAPGETLALDLGWRLLDRPDGDYSVSVQVVDAARQIVAQDDRALSGGRDLVRAWQPGAVVTITHRLRLPAETSGLFTIHASLYRPDDPTQYLVLDETNAPIGALDLALRVKPTQVPQTRLPPAAPLAEFAGPLYLLRATAHPPSAAGEPFRAELAWTAGAELGTSYTIFAHLVSPAGTMIAQHDAQPQAGRYPTTIWAAGELVTDAIEIALPPAAAGQTVCLRLGLYDARTLTRLPRRDAPADFWQGDACWTLPG